MRSPIEATVIAELRPASTNDVVAPPIVFHRSGASNTSLPLLLPGKS